MKWLGRLHGRFVFRRRVEILARHVSMLVPPGASLLDVGCGDGELAHRIATLRPDIQIHGVDVLVRQTTRIPVERFDGQHLPAADRSFDVVMLIDVLHHTDNATSLLEEAARVARHGVVIKDHLSDQWLAHGTLRFMDWIGNAPHGVRLPYNYWPRQRWRDAFECVGLYIDEWKGQLKLYPWPASLVFDRQLHFMASLRPTHTAPLE